MKFASLQSTLALIASLALALPAGAQTIVETRPGPQPGETAMEYAERIGACYDGEGILSARFIDPSEYDDAVAQVNVRCQKAGVVADGMSGGLGIGAIAAGAAVVAIIAVAASNGGGSSTPDTN